MDNKNNTQIKCRSHSCKEDTLYTAKIPNGLYPAASFCNSSHNNTVSSDETTTSSFDSNDGEVTSTRFSSLYPGGVRPSGSSITLHKTPSMQINIDLPKLRESIQSARSISSRQALLGPEDNNFDPGAGFSSHKNKGQQQIEGLHDNGNCPSVRFPNCKLIKPEHFVTHGNWTHVCPALLNIPVASQKRQEKEKTTTNSPNAGNNNLPEQKYNLSTSKENRKKQLKNKDLQGLRQMQKEQIQEAQKMRTSMIAAARKSADVQRENSKQWILDQRTMMKEKCNEIKVAAHQTAAASPSVVASNTNPVSDNDGKMLSYNPLYTIINNKS